jgi:uncharacterized protein (TIGR02246 family)
MLLLLAVALLIPSAAAPAFPHHKAPPTLPTRQFAEDLHSKDIEDILSLYTPDAVVSDPTGQTSAGADSLRKLYEQTFATYDTDINFTQVSLAVADGQSKAVEIDDYQETVLTKATKSIEQNCGVCTSAWVMQSDGRWQMTSQKWTSKPCAGAAVK